MGFWKRLIRLVNPYFGRTVDELLRHAQDAIGKRDVNVALRAVLYAWRQDPLNVRVYLALGVCCDLKRWHANAVACFLRVLDFDPHNQVAKMSIRQIEEFLEETYQHLFRHPLFGAFAQTESAKDVPALMRSMHQQKTDDAYCELCRGLFIPRP